MVVALALTVKASSGIICLLILLSYWSINFYAKSINLKIFLTSCISLCTTFLLIWFLLYQNLSGILEYFIAIIELSKGNSSAMTINPPNNWWILTLFILSFFIFPFVLKDKNIFFLYALMLVPTVVFFKYAFSRADASHVVVFLIYLAQFFYIVLILSKDIQKKHILLPSAIAILFILTNPDINVVKNFFKPIINNLSNKPYISYKHSYQNLLKKSDVLLNEKKLDKEVLEIIQNSTIDTYPWDASYIVANKLNWKPRPIFQSYITYTPYLDMKNASFYNSTRGPDFILWAKKHEGGEVGSIDERYLLNDEPLTLFQILNHYKPVYESPDLLLLKRSKHEFLGQTTTVQESTHQWNSWIKTPNNIPLMNNILRAGVNIERTLIQKVKKLLYKEFEVYITYKFENGEEEKYRIVVDNAINGLWINPFQKKLLDYDWTNKVIAIKLTHSEGDYFNNTIRIKWEITKVIHNLLKN